MIDKRWVDIGPWKKTPWYLRLFLNYPESRRKVTSINYPDNYYYEYDHFKYL